MEYIILALISCYGLSPDQQSYCQARQHNNPAYCYSISDPALRQTCRSEIEKTPWVCDGITDQEERRLCRNKAAGK
jgi:hypothetical protein